MFARDIQILAYGLGWPMVASLAAAFGPVVL